MANLYFNRLRCIIPEAKRRSIPIVNVDTFEVYPFDQPAETSAFASIPRRHHIQS